MSTKRLVFGDRKLGLFPARFPGLKPVFFSVVWDEQDFPHVQELLK